MGCNNTKTNLPDPDEDEEKASYTQVAKERTTQSSNTTTTNTTTSNNNKDKDKDEDQAEEEEDVPRKNFGKAQRRDSVKYNKDAIAKRKQHNQNIADGIENKADMPRAFMKEGITSGLPAGVVIQKSGKKRGFNRRDSIKINKDAIEKKKKRASASEVLAAPEGITLGLK